MKERGANEGPIVDPLVSSSIWGKVEYVEQDGKSLVDLNWEADSPKPLSASLIPYTQYAIIYNQATKLPEKNYQLHMS